MPFQLDTVFVFVGDLDAAVEWYSRFGIEAGPRYGPWQTMSLEGETRFALHHGQRPEGPDTGGIAFGVPSLDNEIDRLRKLGIEPDDDEITDAGVARFVSFQDPDRNDVQLLQR